MRRGFDPAMPDERRCSHPDCNARLDIASNTYDVGLCRKHGGRKAGKSVVAPPAPSHEGPERPHVRSVQVPVFGTTSANNTRVRVSLKKEPWA